MQHSIAQASTKLDTIKRKTTALQVPELPVYGVAIPTVSGMRLVLDELGAAQGLNTWS